MNDKHNTEKPHVRSSSSTEIKDSLGVVALAILLREMGGKSKQWLPSTRELRLVSLEVCNSCRRTLVFRVWVGRSTPRSLWEAAELTEAHGHRSFMSTGRGHRTRLLLRSRPRSRLSNVRAVKVVWDRPVADIPSARFFLQSVAHFQLGFHFDTNPPQGLASLPEGLVVLDLGPRFGLDLSKVTWPAGLRELRLGASFDRPLSGIALPPGLRRLTFGANFNKPIDGVAWPTSLRVLEFGRRFDQPVATDAVSWPGQLESLSFGRDFSHDLAIVSEPKAALASAAGSRIRGWWPTSLRRLTLLEGFRQPIDTVAWPEGLEELYLDCVFVRKGSAGAASEAEGATNNTSSIAWPPGLKKLSFDLNFHQPLQDIPLPPSLEELAFGDSFDQPVRGVCLLPRGLKRLSFGASFNRSVEGVDFPSSIEHLAFGCRFNRSLKRVRWPQGLRRLVLRDHFDQPIHAVAWPATLRTLEFGWRFNQPLPDESSWPPCLERLILGKNFDQPAESFSLPSSLVFLEFGEGCRQGLRGVKWPRGLKEVCVGRGGRILVDEKEILKNMPKGCMILRKQGD